MFKFIIKRYGKANLDRLNMGLTHHIEHENTVNVGEEGSEGNVTYNTVKLPSIAKNRPCR